MIKCPLPDFIVVGLAQRHISHMFGFMSALVEQPGQRGRKLGVNDPAHGEWVLVTGHSAHQDGVVALRCGELQAGVNIRRFQIGKVFENF